MTENKRFRFDDDMNIEEYKDNGVFIKSYTFRYNYGNKWDYDREKILDKFNEMDSEIKRLEKENKGLNEQLSAMKSNGLKVLEFYEYKLKNADKKEFENAREELWIVKEVLCEMGVIKND